MHIWVGRIQVVLDRWCVRVDCWLDVCALECVSVVVSCCWKGGLDQMSLIKKPMYCGTVLRDLIYMASLTLRWCQNWTGVMSLVSFQLMRWSCSWECLMMADLSRCPSLSCAWCSLTLADMLRPVSRCILYRIRREFGKHQPYIVCPVCPCVFVVMLESCLVPCRRSWLELDWRCVVACVMRGWCMGGWR